jgi:hypothetical protein
VIFQRLAVSKLLGHDIHQLANRGFANFILWYLHKNSLPLFVMFDMFSAFISAASINVGVAHSGQILPIKYVAVNRMIVLSESRKTADGIKWDLFRTSAQSKCLYSFISIACILSNNLLMIDKMNTNWK